MKSIRRFAKIFIAVLLLVVVGAEVLRQNPNLLATAQSTIFESSLQPRGTRIQILHASDFEAGIPAIEDAPRFSAVINGLKAEFPERTLVLSSGDNYIPSPFYNAGSDPALNNIGGLGSSGSPLAGRADIAILNALGVQASALGNHEFDQGTNQVAALLGTGSGNPGTNFPYLSANLDFSTDANLRSLVTADGQLATAARGRLAKSAIVTTADGTRVGVVGAVTPGLTSITSTGGVTVLPANQSVDNPNLPALAAAIQPAVDALVAQGIDKIILLAHMQQFRVEFGLAPLLRNVDVIIAGGSHSVFADADDRLRTNDRSQAFYPSLFTSASGEPVIVINTGANYRYVGRLVVDFDRNGKIIPITIEPGRNGAYATDAAGVAATGNASPDPRISAIASTVSNVVISKEGVIFGNTSVYLNGRRDDVRTQETNLGNLTADANLAAARRSDPTTVISLKNGGGIRDSIGAIVAPGGSSSASDVQFLPPLAVPAANKQAGNVSLLDIENSLRFNNGLTLVTVTANQLARLIEHGVAGTRAGATPGQFPQVGGMAFSFDPARPAVAGGATISRLRTLVVLNDNGSVRDLVVQNGAVVGDPNRTFRLVTLGFLVGAPNATAGGDGYPFPQIIAENVQRANRRDLAPSSGNTITTEGAEQKAIADFLRDRFSTTAFSQADLPPAQDRRIQNLAVRSDTVASGIQ
ncbi:MAG: bifunctional metallophosphatase/5'-nucleotidase [Pseudanabaenaceae cyanobacterium bins.68]|nr:bifunctional metallophosphatase/5'-nucleotidase [Pseudanabaenaceae cyanobacterium bins.68]